MTWPTKTANAEGFPKLTISPEAPYKASFAGKWSIFRFDEKGSEGPIAGFDAEGSTYILSAASNFMVASTARNAAGALETRINPAIKTLPPGFTHEALLAVGHGINHTFDVWGQALTDLSGKVRPPNDADPGLATLGYWTDNGSAYYYDYDPALGYDGTLLAVRDAFAASGPALGYVQLDSWWYPKGDTGDWNPPPNQWNFGIGTYEAHRSLFPSGLPAFHQALGLPIHTHARWIDEKSPYRKRYKMSNNVIIDRAYWDTIADYLKAAGVYAYEQDWLDQKATAAYTIGDQNAFMDEMAAAMASRALTMQYCMATPRHLMQGSRYDNLTTARLSEDIFCRDRWDQFLYSSRLASALGIWPWSDTFRSAERDNLLLATLSAGLVGIGDAIGEITPANLLMAARTDGVLVKPDTPLVPTDATILADARHVSSPLVAWATTDFGPVRAAYVFAHARGNQSSASFSPAEVGFSGSVFVWDALAGTGHVAPASDPVVQKLTDGRSYDILVPVGARGIALVGDVGKFVTLGKKRFASLDDLDGRLEATLVFAPGEDSVTLVGWASDEPGVGSTGPFDLAWDAATGVFRLRISPGADGTTRLVLRPHVDRSLPDRD